MILILMSKELREAEQREAEQREAEQSDALYCRLELVSRGRTRGEPST
jgi:hypothetical protein